MRYERPAALVGASLADRGLLSLETVLAAAAIGAFALGLAVARPIAAAAAPLLAGAVLAGVALGWWANGFADGWTVVFAAWTAGAVVLTGTGVAVARFLGARLPVAGVAWRAAVAAATLGAVGLVWFLATRPADAGVASPAPVYYLGESFAGYRLTHAEVGNGRAFFVYGDCEHPVGRADGGCAPPIQLQEQYPPTTDQPRAGGCPQPGPLREGEDPYSAAVFAGATMIEIYAPDRAHLRRAAAALGPVPGACD